MIDQQIPELTVEIAAGKGCEYRPHLSGPQKLEARAKNIGARAATDKTDLRRLMFNEHRGVQGDRIVQLPASRNPNRVGGTIRTIRPINAQTVKESQSDLGEGEVIERDPSIPDEPTQ
jgi:hypothetical protein